MKWHMFVVDFQAKKILFRKVTDIIIINSYGDDNLIDQDKMKHDSHDSHVAKSDELHEDKSLLENHLTIMMDSFVF